MLADIYHTEFNELFDGTFSNDKTNNTVHTLTVGITPVEVAFAPTDGVQQRIINAITSANTSVQVTMFTFTNQAIAQALIAAKQRGVAVEVILDSLAAGSQFSQRNPLCAAGVMVHVEDWDGKLHDKYAVVDAGTTSDPLIVTGSTNWTGNAVSANDENLLIVHAPNLAQAYAGDFARLRGAIGSTAFACNVAGVANAYGYTNAYYDGDGYCNQHSDGYDDSKPNSDGDPNQEEQYTHGVSADCCEGSGCAAAICCPKCNQLSWHHISMIHFLTLAQDCGCGRFQEWHFLRCEIGHSLCLSLHGAHATIDGVL